MRHMLICLGVLYFGAIAAPAQLPYCGAGWEERQAMIHAIYGAMEPRILGLTEPIDILAAGRPEPGGLYVRFQDANGKKMTACLDMRLRSPSFPLPPPLVYFNAEYFEDPGAQPVPQRGPEESALYGILVRWSKTRPSFEELHVIPEGQRTEEQTLALNTLQFLKLLDMRYIPVPN